MPDDLPGKTSLPDLRYLRELARVAKNYELSEVEIESGEHRILLRRGGEPGGGVAMPTVISPAVSPAVSPVAPPPVSPAAAAPTVDEGHYITAPFVGTFYRSPTPEAPSFVEVGASVTEGQTLCIIEAMKLFNELEAEFPCVIEEVFVDNAQPVEYGARLFKVRKL